MNTGTERDGTMKQFPARSRGSVIVVAVAILLLLSVLAVTYITVMEIEVSSNEAFQFGIKADMVVNWVVSDACALIQSTVRNVGIYEDDANHPHAVWGGLDYADPAARKAGKHPMYWKNVPHNWHMLPTADFRRYDFDCYNMFFYNPQEPAPGEKKLFGFFGYESPEGRIFGEESAYLWWGYQAYDMDMLNLDGDYDPRTHRQARWRTYRNPDPTKADTWDNIYARSACMILSTQAMLYLGEYRGDYTDRTTAAGYVEGHVRRMPRSGGRLTQAVRPLGYNLAVYKGGVPNGGDAAGDTTHLGVERVDRDKLSPSPECAGLATTGTGGSPRDIAYFPTGANILDNNDPLDMPDIEYWRGGEGMMNINALIRMLTHLVNERAAVAIAKHRPYRTKQQILQAIDAEGATLTTTEYARLMANVTCHANYDPVTGLCPLNINKLRSPQSICPQWAVGPDPLLAANYDREVTNYIPDKGLRYQYKIITYQEYVNMNAPIPTQMAEDDKSFWDYKPQWAAGTYEQALWDVLYPGIVDQGDFDPATGAYFNTKANGVRVTNRLLWAAFSCIPSLVITSATTGPNGGSPHEASYFDQYWNKLAQYAQREYTQAISHAPTMKGGYIRSNFTPADVLQTVIGIIQNATGGKLNYAPRNAYQMGSGARVWMNYTHPAWFAFNNKGKSGWAVGVGRVLPNSTSHGESCSLNNMPGTDDPGFWPRFWGWSPVQQGSGAYLSECCHRTDPDGNDYAPTGYPEGANAMGNIWRTDLGRCIEDMDRFEEIIAWMAPFHPVANPHGRGIITERQANDILNNFIDFRDNIKDPNNLLTDWKLHSQEYDRGNYDAYRAGEINKDGYLDAQRLNTVCSMTNWSTFTSTTCRFPDVGTPQGAGILAKVPYVYIREPYFDADAYTRNPDLDKDNTTGSYASIAYYDANHLDWATKRKPLAKGESIIELDWNTYTGGDATLRGYGDPKIMTRNRSITDNLFPWVNDLDHQEFNITGIREAGKETTYKNLCWIRNHNYVNLNWTKDWVAYNYHRNMHKRDEFRRVTFGGDAATPSPYYPEDADFIAEGYKGTAADEKLANPDYTADTDSSTNNDLNGNKVSDNGHVETVYPYYYYESPGLMFGPDRIPDAYQTLNKGHVLVDLSRYYEANWRLDKHTVYPEDLNDNGVLDPGEDIDGNGILTPYTYTTQSINYSEGVGTTQRFADLRDTNDDKIPDTGPDTGGNRDKNIGELGDPLADARICLYDRAFDMFLNNCTDRKGPGADDVSYYVYGYEASDPENTDNAFMDADCKVMTYFGYRGSEYVYNDHYKDPDGSGHTNKNWNGSGWGDATGGDYACMGRFDFKTDSPYFHGTSVRARRTKGNSWCTFASLVTLYNKPYLYDVPMKSPLKSTGSFSSVTFGYSYNYGRNIYAYDFDGNALAIKTCHPQVEDDVICPTMFKMVTRVLGDGTTTIAYEPEQYGEKGVVAGSGGRVSIPGAPRPGYHLPTVKTRYGQSNMNDIVPRFNAVEPFFDPMYPNGRLFYRRLMTCGDTTIVLDENYKNGPDTGNNLQAVTVDGYDPMDFSTYTANNIFKTVASRHVKYENDDSKNPFITDGCPCNNNPLVNTETWPVAGGDSANSTHWNHVFNARYAIPYIVGVAANEAEKQHCCADAPWSVPFTTRDRFYEIHVRAEIVNAGVSDIGMYQGPAGEKWLGWRGHEILASKQAVAIFDRGWRWAYWDDRINRAAPWYDPFRMVGSRPGVDAAYESVTKNITPAYAGMFYDNEMFSVSDWRDTTGDGIPDKYARMPGRTQVKVGYIAPAEYSGVNRQGDDCAERARIVFFKWVGVSQ